MIKLSEECASVYVCSQSLMCARKKHMRDRVRCVRTSNVHPVLCAGSSLGRIYEHQTKKCFCRIACIIGRGEKKVATTIAKIRTKSK